MHSSEHELWIVVYKIDYFVKRSLSSFLVLPNTRLPLNLTLRVLSYNSWALGLRDILARQGKLS